MPDNKDYISNTYNAIKEKVEGFNRTPEEYRKLMSTDSKYRQNVYNTLKEKVEGFERTPQEFDSLVIGKPQKEVAPKAEEKFGPLPAKQPTFGRIAEIYREMPTFEQQQETIRTPLKYGQAAARDRTETGKLFATTWNNFVGGAESLLAGTIARGAGASPYAGQQAMIEAVRTGRTKTIGETIKDIEEAPKKQAAIEKEAYKKIEELTGAIKSDYVTTEEAQGISEIDFTNKSFSENAKALIASGGRLAFDIPVGAITGGTSYYLQSYGESVRDYDRMVEKGQLEANPLAREFYGNTVGLVSAALEKFAIDKIFGAGPALKNIQRKAVANVFGKISKSATPLSAKTTEKLVENEIRALSANIKARGAKTVYSSAVEGGTEGLQTAMTEGAKIITNKIQGQEVYDEKEIVDNIGKNIFNASVAGGIYGVPMGAVASFGKNVNTSVLKDIAEAKTDEDFVKIDNDLEEVFVANNYSPEDREAVSATVRNYARIKQKLPPLTPPEVQEKVIPLIEQRDKIDEELKAKKESAANLDEAVAADEASDIEMLEAKRASINDEIRSEVAGTEFTYFEQDGKFFKQLGENRPEEITKIRFDLESIRQEDKQLAQDEEDAPTVLDMMDKPVIINGERATLTQEGQTVIAKVLGKERVIEVGNIDEIGNQKLSDVGLTQEESAVTIGDAGNIVVRGTEFVNLFTDPLAAINRNANGDVISVNLETADGKKRTFRGATADDVAYQIILKNITENNETRQQFEDFVEANEPIKQELEFGQVTETTIEAAPVVAEQVPVVAEKEVTPANEVERLRAEEQKELAAAIPNIEQYKVDGVVDRTKITNEEELAKFDEIYNKYDKLITPLLETPKLLDKNTQYIFEYKDARDLAHRVKNGEVSAIRQMAKELATKIPKDAVIVPMSSRTGRATNMLSVANEIAKINGNTVADIITGAKRESLYEAKKKGKDISKINLGLKLRGNIPQGKIYVIDNVIATGVTAKSIQEILPKAIVLAHSMDRTSAYSASKETSTPISKGVPLFNIDGKDKFFHASPTKITGPLKKSTAKGFGTGIYFSTNKDIVKSEFGENVTEVSLNIENPVYTNTKEWSDVQSLAIKLADADYGKKKGLTLEEGETFHRYDSENLSEIDEIPSEFISKAAQELGHDAIVDKGSAAYDNEVLVLDESKIQYKEVVEEKPAEKKPKMVTQTGLLVPANGRVVMVGEANPNFQNTFIVLGEDTTIEMPNGETRDAAFAVVEMDDILASHDENSFNDTDGYPSQNGMNANPRNYKTDAVAMDKVNRDANNLKPSIVISDSATPETGVPIITTDGIVVSGNGRTMAIKLAQRIAPEKYAEYRNNLEKRAAKFGIDAAEVKKMRNPVLVKMDTKIKEYSIKELDAYNQKAQKGESPVDKAIKRAGIITANKKLKDGILRIIEGYNTMSELFDNKADRSAIIDLFEANGIITAQERSEYVGANKELTEDGKDLVNDVLIATIISPEVMRATDNVKSFKKNIVNALPLLTENYRNKDYSLEELINNAILLQSEMVSRGYKLDEFYDFISQIQMGRPHNPDAVVMNRMIAEGPNKFKDFVRKYNVAAETSEGGMFASEALTREQALGQLAKTEDKISENERKIIASLAGIYAEYERGQQAGTAKVFEQPIVEQVTEQEAADFPEFVNGQFSNPKFEQQYQDEKTTAFGFTETREQFVARKFC